ncbi:MAG: hypothetical protein WCX65_19360, partial [bacterium]
MKARFKGLSNKIRLFAGLLAAPAIILTIASCGSAPTPRDTGDFDIGAFKVPWGMALDQTATRLYFVNNVANTVEVLDVATMVVQKTIPVLCSPRNLTFNSDFTKLYVTHDDQNQCTKSQTSYLKRDGSWASVISIAEMKVVKEINVDIGGVYVSNSRDIVYYHDPSKPASDYSKDVIYITGFTSESNAGRTALISPNTDAPIAFLTLDAGTPHPFKVKVDTSSSRNLLYVLDSAASTIGVKNAVDPSANQFETYAYNGQSDGYCVGSSSGNKNNCPCSSGSECNSGVCETSALIP